MWVLEYEYTGDNGGQSKVSCVLYQGIKQYSVGRSSKNAFPIKHDKSISRNHLDIRWTPAGALELVNHGKLSMCRGKYLKADERVLVRPNDISCSINLGTKPVEVQIKWREVFWDIPESLARFTVTLSGLGIAPRARGPESIMIWDGSPADCYRILLGYSKNMPIKRSTLLTDTCNKLTTLHSDAWALWSEILKDNKLDIKKEPTFQKIKIPQDIMIVLMPNNGINNVTEILSLIEAKFHIYEGSKTSNVSQVLLSLNYTKYILVAASGHVDGELIFVTMEKFLDSIQSGKLSTILSFVKGQNKTNTPTDEVDHGTTQEKRFIKENVEENVEPPKKKKRISRPRVQPLDSLSFFAGGAPTDDRNQSLPAAIDEHSKPTANKDESFLVNGTEAMCDANETNVFTKDKNDLANPTPNTTKSASLGKVENKSPNHNSLALFEKMNLSRQEEINSDSKASSDVISQTPKHHVRISAAKRLNSFVNDTSDEESGNISSSETKTLNDFRRNGNSVTSRPSSRHEALVKAVQDTKSREVQRFNSTVVEIHNDELTDHALDKLQALAIVERNTELLRPKEPLPNNSNQITENLGYKGRKNFKRFIKAWPKYMHKSGTLTIGVAIKHPGNAITRRYIPLQDYATVSDRTHMTGGSILDRLSQSDVNTPGEGNTINHAIANISHEPKTEQLAMPKNPLFVTEEASDDDVSMGDSNPKMQAGLKLVPTRSNMSALADTSQNMKYMSLDAVNGSDAYQTKERLDGVLELDGMNKEDQQINNPNCFNRSDNDDNDDDNDDDDDDDDGPKFRFSRQR